MKSQVIRIALACAVFVLVGSMLAAQPCCCVTVDMKVSPNTLNLKQNGNWVTVHVELPYVLVDDDTVQLAISGCSAEPIYAATTFADDCGDLVAKFHLEDVKAMIGECYEDLEDESISFTLTGDDISGKGFTGTDVIRVINKGKKNK